MTRVRCRLIRTCWYDGWHDDQSNLPLTFLPHAERPRLFPDAHYHQKWHCIPSISVLAHFNRSCFPYPDVSIFSTFPTPKPRGEPATNAPVHILNFLFKK